MNLRDHLIIGLVIVLATFTANIGVEWWKGEQSKELSQQERIWNLKMPIYMKLAEEFEGLFISEDSEINAEDKMRSFNTLFNKMFLVGNDKLIEQLNQTDNTDTREYIKKAMILMRKELDPNTTLTSKHHIRKKLSREEEDFMYSFTISTASLDAPSLSMPISRSDVKDIIDNETELKELLYKAIEKSPQKIEQIKLDGEPVDIDKTSIKAIRKSSGEYLLTGKMSSKTKTIKVSFEPKAANQTIIFIPTGFEYENN